MGVTHGPTGGELRPAARGAAHHLVLARWANGNHGARGIGQGVPAAFRPRQGHCAPPRSGRPSHSRTPGIAGGIVRADRDRRPVTLGIAERNK